MFGQPLVSIIIPVYKVEKYLCRCLDSVIGQTLKNIEIICVDDGSPDNCPRILDEYADIDSRIKVIHQHNGGLSAARNAGLELATASYIGFVDSDDWIEPETYEVASQLMLDDDEIDCVSWGINHYNEDTMEVDLEETEQKNRYFFENPGKHQLSGEIKLRAFATAWNKLYKSDLIKNHNLTFPTGLIYEDIAFWWQYNAHANYGYFLDKYYSNYLKRSDSIMGRTKVRKSEKPFDFLMITRFILDYYLDNDLFAQHADSLKLMIDTTILAGYGYTGEPASYRRQALKLIDDYGFLRNEFKPLLKRLSRSQDYSRPKYTALERLMSVKNVGSFKVFKILGIELKIRRKNKN